MTTNEWIALAATMGVYIVPMVVGVLRLNTAVVTLTAKVSDICKKLDKVIAFQDSRPCERHAAAIDDLKEEVDRLRNGGR